MQANKKRSLEIVDTIIIPKSWSTAIYYGDLSGFEDTEELEVVKQVISDIGPKTVDFGEDMGFMYCGLIGLYVDCIEVNVFDYV